MREKPILFSGPMVRAILEGRKTMTRRVGERYGKWFPCDHLWVREAFYVQPELWDAGHGPQPIHYAADVTDIATVGDYRLRPGMFMPRWAFRITLEVVSIRPERLQDITEGDARAEGFRDVQDFRKLWNHLNAPRGYGWDTNPMVWRIEFKRLPAEKKEEGQG